MSNQIHHDSNGELSYGADAIEKGIAEKETELKNQFSPKRKSDKIIIKTVAEFLIHNAPLFGPREYDLQYLVVQANALANLTAEVALIQGMKGMNLELNKVFSSEDFNNLCIMSNGLGMALNMARLKIRIERDKQDSDLDYEKYALAIKSLSNIFDNLRITRPINKPLE